MNKIYNKNKDLILIITFLTLVIVFLFILSQTFSFFFAKKEGSGEIQLGELDFAININSQNYDNIMPGDTVLINAEILNNIKNKNNLVPFYFRFAFLDNINNKKEFLKINSENFIYDSNSNYYYYKYKVSTNEKVKLFDELSFSYVITENDINNINGEIKVEAVQSEYGAYKDIFYDAPQEWIDFIENK